MHLSNKLDPRKTFDCVPVLTTAFLQRTRLRRLHNDHVYDLSNNEHAYDLSTLNTTSPHRTRLRPLHNDHDLD